MIKENYELWFWPTDDQQELMYSLQVDNSYIYFFKEYPCVQFQNPKKLGWVYIGKL